MPRTRRAGCNTTTRAVRAGSQMISYELVMGLTIVGLILIFNNAAIIVTVIYAVIIGVRIELIGSI